LAIELSKNSKFIHEEGLSCELAGMHQERVGNTSKALSLFQQAESCYNQWGNERKARKMAEKVKRLLKSSV
jgi:hypothetical protein